MSSGEDSKGSDEEQCVSGQAKRSKRLGDPNRERGLTYIIDKLDQRGKVTEDDVNIFLSDLHLPYMSRKVLEKKIRAAGAPSTGFTSIGL